MSNFVRLTEALSECFDKALADMPSALAARVRRDLVPIPWDSLTVDQRIEAASLWDYQNDPATAGHRETCWNLFVRRHNLDRQILELGQLPVGSPLERESKVRQMSALKRELKAVQAELSRVQLALPDFEASHHERRRKYEKPNAHPAGKYVHYLKARDILNGRLEGGTGAGEIAMWLCAGKKEAGLEGYRDAPQYSDPRVFRFPEYELDSEYLSALMHCYFLRAEVEAFVPRDRYLTYSQLVERWKALLSEREAIALVRAKGASSELAGFHPVTGGVQGAGMWRDEEDFPPLEEGMFWLAQVQAIESEWSADTPSVDMSADSRGARSTIKAENECRNWLTSLMKEGPSKKPKNHFRAVAKARFGVSSRAFDRAWAAAKNAAGNDAWGQPGRKSKR